MFAVENENNMCLWRCLSKSVHHLYYVNFQETKKENICSHMGLSAIPLLFELKTRKITGHFLRKKITIVIKNTVYSCSLEAHV